MKISELRPGAEAPPPQIEEHAEGGSAMPERTKLGAGNIWREVDTNGICTLTFDRSNSTANFFDQPTLLELDSHLDWLERAPGIRGLILWSAKETIFIAGADLHALGGMADRPASAPAHDNPLRAPGKEPEPPRNALLELLQLGQGVFNRLASLPVPTIAAIHGACVGGGFELALACERRLATSSSMTKIGLPETRLGLIPAWGGCTRLPRLIGIPRALDIILAGKMLSAETALKVGMVDEIVPRQQLLAIAREHLLQRAPLQRSSLRVPNNPVSAMLSRSRAARVLAARTRGNYPAPFEALEVITHGISLPVDQSLALEREAISRLAQTTSCQNLLRIHLAVQKAKKRTSPGQPKGIDPSESHRAAVVGAGVMGTGIAQWLSSRGLAVILRDVSLERLIRGVDAIAQLYAEAVRRQHLTELEARDGKDRIFAAASDVPLRDVDVVIEAATENLTLKQDIFRCLAAQTSPATILATNTSALSITELAAATNAPERIVGLHFFNPVHRMELVEVVAGDKTTMPTQERAMAFARQIGKVPILVQDRPGFVVNRILMPYLLEAVRLFDSGANAHDIDEAMLNFGMPMGPLRLLDEVGLDVAAHVVATLEKHYGPRVAAPPLIQRMLAANMVGQKSGQGFYQHPHHRVNPEAGPMRAIHRHLQMTAAELTERMTLLMVNEAARCVEERVVSSPADVDLAMVLGTGFARFLGGPLRYADARGAASVVAALERLARSDSRFNTCALLKHLAATGESFYSRKGAGL